MATGANSKTNTAIMANRSSNFFTKCLLWSQRAVLRAPTFPVSPTFLCFARSVSIEPFPDLGAVADVLQTHPSTPVPTGLCRSPLTPIHPSAWKVCSRQPLPRTAPVLKTLACWTQLSFCRVLAPVCQCPHNILQTHLPRGRSGSLGPELWAPWPKTSPPRMYAKFAFVPNLVLAALPQRYLTTTSPFMPASLWPSTGQYIS